MKRAAPLINMKTILLLLFLSLSVAAKTVALSDYATPNDGLNDSAGFQEAVDEISSGGTILITAGTWDLEDTVTFVTYTNGNNSFVIQGTKGSVLKPDLTDVMFRFGAQNQVLLKDLVIVGDGTSGADCSYAIFASNVHQLRIEGCQFFGTKATYSIIYIGNVDAIIRDTIFHGMSSSIAVIEAVNFRGLTITDCEFIDYGNFDGSYYSKTPYGVGVWVKASASNQPTPNANAQRGVYVSNVRFDEGAFYALHLINLKYADISRVLVNVSAYSGSAGIVLNNVRLAKIEHSMFGYSTNPRPAMLLSNNSKATANGITLGDSVFASTVDGTSSVNISECDGCSL